MTIDTLKYVKTLEAVGVERKVAEAHADAFGKALTEVYVTKSHFDAVLSDLKRDFEVKISDLKLEIAGVKADVLLMKWMLGFNLAVSVGVLIKLLA